MRHWNRLRSCGHDFQTFHFEGRGIDETFPNNVQKDFGRCTKEGKFNSYAELWSNFTSIVHEAKLVAADGLDIWRGFYQSLRSTQMGTTTIVDVSSAPFLRPLPVLDFISKFLKINTSHKLNDQQRKKITDAFNKVKVEITHRKGVRLIY
ncbi:hypothetical protein ACS0TY_028186 [Phlomoides rotata]